MPDQAVWKPFRDFVIRIEQTGENRYRVRARTFDDREAATTFESPFGEKDLKIFLLTVGQPRRTVRRGRVPQPVRETVAFGQALFDAILSGPVGQLFASARHDAFLGDYGLRVQLRLSGAPHLANLPWEFLYDGRDFLALLPDSPVVRYLDLERPPRPMAVAPPLNMLVTISAPSDLLQLNADEERDKLLDALRGMDADKRPRVEFTPDAQLTTLQRTLRQARLHGRPFHIWHYIGHGGYDPEQRSSFLLFTTRSGAPERVDGFQLGTLFAGLPEIRLAVLNACEGARTDTEDPFAGVATALVEKGIPAVIAMQFEISDEVAARLSAEFYAALAEGLPVDAALTEARRSVFLMPNYLEWATPVLFMRTPDGRLFDVQDVPAASASPARPPEPARTRAVDEAELERLWISASAAYHTENWQRAIDLLERIVAVEPGYRLASSRLEKAQHMQRCTALYEDGCRAIEQSDWRDAVLLLSQVADIDASFRDVERQLAEARRQARLAELVEEAGMLSRAGHWQAVVRVFDRMHALAPDFPDPDDLLPRATAELHAVEQRSQAEQLYRAAIEAIDHSDWTTAEQALTQVQQVSPGFEATEALLQRVRRELLAALPPRLVINLTADPDVVEEGDSVTWTVHIHNAGQVDLHDVRVVRDYRTMEGPLQLSAGEARTLTFTSTFTAAGEKTRKVTISGKTAHGAEVTADVSATATVRPKQPASPRERVSASIAILPDRTTVTAGEQLTWTATVRNDGIVELRRLTLERDGKVVETFALAPGQQRQFTSQSRYTAPGVKEKVVTISGTSGGQRIFEVASASVEVLATKPQRPAARPASASAAANASPAVFREYLKALARETLYQTDCPICGVSVSADNLVRHYDKVHAGQPGPIPTSYSPPPAPVSHKKAPAAAPTYRDRLKEFARQNRDQMIACPVCGVPVNTDNILRHYDRQHLGAVGSEPAAGSAPAAQRTVSRGSSPPPAQDPATAYREELKAAVKQYQPDDYVYCPLCQATVKAGGLIRHYDKTHPGEYPT